MKKHASTVVNSRFFPIIIIGTILVVVTFVISNQLNNDFNLPKTSSENISASPDSIITTNGIKHSIPLEDIFDGCFGRDCTPSIQKPNFVDKKDLPSWFDSEGLGISVSIAGENRFYPYQVLVSHEIVNDSFGHKKVVVTYSPLTFSGIVFEREFEDAILDFGVSGKLWNTNLLMYDRQKDNLWSQISGRAVVGENTGLELTTLPSDVVAYKQWAANNDGKILIGSNNEVKDYSVTPYGGNLTDIKPFLPYANEGDTRLPYNAYILGIEFDGKTKAYSVDKIKQVGELNDSFEGREIKVKYNSTTGTTRVYEMIDGKEVRINTVVPSFWFSWAATHPKTDIYGDK